MGEAAQGGADTADPAGPGEAAPGDPWVPGAITIE
jgi:hypothetical protein